MSFAGQRRYKVQNATAGGHPAVVLREEFSTPTDAGDGGGPTLAHVVVVTNGRRVWSFRCEAPDARVFPQRQALCRTMLATLRFH